MPPSMRNGETPRANVNDVSTQVQERHPVLGVCLSCSIAVFALQACAAPPATSHETTRLDLTGEPLTLPPDRANTARIGQVTWMGGLELRSPNARFGGLSALLISPDGTRVTAVSDKGRWLSFPLRHDADGYLIGVDAGTIAPLRGLNGKPLGDRWDKDAESLARLPDGSLAVAFERNHRLWRYGPGAEPLSGIPTPLTPPIDLNALGRNSGIEALSDLGGGNLLAIAEGKEGAGESPAFLKRGKQWHSLTYARDSDFRPTGAARLPDGDILVVERFFNVLEGVRIRLVRVPGAAVRPGVRLKGEVIATLAPPLPLDNMEGVALRQGANGETLIYLISDDNFNVLQRTLLMLFVLRQ